MRVEFQYPVFDPPLGGVENYIIEGAEALTALGHECQIFCGPPRKESQQTTITVYRHAESRPQGLSLLWRPLAETNELVALEASVSRPTPDIVVARHPSYAIAAATHFGQKTHVIYLPAVDMASRTRAEGVRSKSFKAHVLTHLFTWLWQRVERQACAVADTVMVLSQNMARQMSRYTKLPVQVNPAGINIDRFKPDLPTRKTIREKLLGAAEKETTLLVTLSRLSAEKNITFALELVSQLPKHTHYAVLGTGDLLPALTARCEALGIASQVTFTGLVDNPQCYLAAADLYLHPATTEPFGHALLEAMACGLPVAATASKEGRYLVATEEIVPADCGIYLDVDDCRTTARDVADFIADEPKRRAAGTAAMKRVIDQYSWQRHAKGLVGVNPTSPSC